MSISYGFASREEGGCLGTRSCGSTWGAYEACCPWNSICQNPYNPVCCNTNNRNCTNILLPKPKCANDTWTLYDQRSYFCCRPGTVGYKTGKGDWSGCAAHGFKFEAKDSVLIPIAVTSGGCLDYGCVGKCLADYVQQHSRRFLSSIPVPPRLLPQLQQQPSQRKQTYTCNMLCQVVKTTLQSLRRAFLYQSRFFFALACAFISA